MAESAALRPIRRFMAVSRLSDRPRRTIWRCFSQNARATMNMHFGSADPSISDGTYTTFVSVVKRSRPTVRSASTQRYTRITRPVSTPYIVGSRRSCSGFILQTLDPVSVTLLPFFAAWISVGFVRYGLSRFVCSTILSSLKPDKKTHSSPSGRAGSNARSSSSVVNVTSCCRFLIPRSPLCRASQACSYTRCACLERAVGLCNV